MKLKEMAKVKTGLVTARKEAREPFDKVMQYRQLNLRAIHAEGYIDGEYLEDFFAKEPLREEYLTRCGDVVARLTTPYTAILIDEVWKGVVIPSHFVVIRPDKKRLLPEYLYWLLNTERIREKLQQNISSAMIGTVKPRSYADLDIEMIALTQQKRIAQLNLLAKKELYLLERLREEKKKYYYTALDKIQKEMREN